MNVWSVPLGIHNDTKDALPSIPNPYVMPRNGTMLGCLTFSHIPVSRLIIYKTYQVRPRPESGKVTLFVLSRPFPRFFLESLNRKAFTATCTGVRIRRGQDGEKANKPALSLHYSRIDTCKHLRIHLLRWDGRSVG